MRTKTRQIPKMIPRISSQTIVHTKTYQQPTIIHRIGESYNRFKDKIFTFWYGQPKSLDTTLHEITQLIETIKENKPESMESLDIFLQQNNQKTVNTLLSRLVFSENELNTVNAKVFGLKLGLEAGVTNNKKILQKIINWTHDNIIQLFGLTLPIDENFFLFNLLATDYNLTLIPVIHDNLDYIQRRPTGKKFLTLLSAHNKELYDAIIHRKQSFTEKLKAHVKKYTKKVQFKE